MSFVALTSTELVSNNSLQDAVTTSVIALNPAQSIPVNERFVTKANVLLYVNISASNPFLSAKTSSQLIAKRDITSLTNPDPSTATLTFTSYISGSFTFTLSIPIPSTDILIEGASVTGTTSGACTGGVVTNDSIVPRNAVTIIAGTTTISRLGLTPLTCSVVSYQKIDSIYVNGGLVNNTSVITIGGTSVTIIINTSCNSYTC